MDFEGSKPMEPWMYGQTAKLRLPNCQTFGAKLGESVFFGLLAKVLGASYVLSA